MPYFGTSVGESGEFTLICSEVGFAVAYLCNFDTRILHDVCRLAMCQALNFFTASYDVG